ncbi:MAG: hypothetical protein AAB837_00235 [Patescibacteria group bacterium]
MKNRNQKGGFIKIIIIIVGALVLLKYIYNIDVVGFLTQGKFREFLDQIYSLGAKGWQKYSDVIIKIWNYCLNFIKNIFSKG